QAATKVAVERGACHQPELFAKGGRIWGFMVQLYGVRSQRNWGVGDFGDLRALVELAASLGAGVLGVNPLHAAHVSPYSPSSRHALNAIYLDIEAIPEFAKCAAAQRLTQSRTFLARLLQLRKAERVDYDGVRAAKHEVLELLYACFRRDGARRRRFAEWQANSPKELRDFALFVALREELGSGGWQSWPTEYHDPSLPAVGKFARKKPD